MEQLEQLKKMLGDAQERLKKNPDYKLVHSLEGLISDLELAFGPTDKAPEKVEPLAEIVEAKPEVVEEVATEIVEETAPEATQEMPVETVEAATEQVNEESSVEETAKPAEVVTLHAEETTTEVVMESVEEVATTKLEEIVEAASETVVEVAKEEVTEDVVDALSAMPEVAVDAASVENTEDAFVAKASDEIDPLQSDVLESNLEDALNEMIEASSDTSKKDPLEKNNPFSSMAIMATNGSANSVN